MTNEEFLTKHFIPVPLAAIYRDDFGRTLVSKSWLQDAVSECADYQRTDRLDAPGSFPDDEDREIPPSEWVFDDERKRVTIGSYTMTLRGDIQYRFLRFVCQGGTDAKEAWLKVWHYHNDVEYQTLRNIVSALNAKLEAADLAWRVVTTTKEVGIKIHENPENEGV